MLSAMWSKSVKMCTFVETQYHNVTDGQTDRLIRYIDIALCMLAQADTR